MRPSYSCKLGSIPIDLCCSPACAGAWSCLRRSRCCARTRLAAGFPIPHTMERYKMRGTPSLVLIDRHGFVRKHAFGAVDDLRIGAEIGALTQESDTAVLTRSSAA